MAKQGPIGKALKFAGDVTGYVTEPLMGIVGEADKHLGRVFNPNHYVLVIGPRRFPYPTMSAATRAGVSQAHTGVHSTFQVVKPGGEVVTFGRDGRIMQENSSTINHTKFLKPGQLAFSVASHFTFNRIKNRVTGLEWSGPVSLGSKTRVYKAEDTPQNIRAIESGGGKIYKGRADESEWERIEGEWYRKYKENPMEENPSKIWQRLKRMAGHGSSTWIEYASIPKEADAYKVSGKLEAMGVKHTKIEPTKTGYQVLVLREALRAMGAREEAGKKGGTSHLTVSPLTGVQEEVASALVNMGASEKAAREKVKAKWKTGMSFDDLFRAAGAKANPMAYRRNFSSGEMNSDSNEPEGCGDHSMNANPNQGTPAFKAGYRYYLSRIRSTKGSFSVQNAAVTYSKKFGEKDMSGAYANEATRARIQAAKDAYSEFLDGTEQAHNDRIKKQHPDYEENPSADYGIRGISEGNSQDYSEWLTKAEAIKQARALAREYPDGEFEVFRHDTGDGPVWSSRRNPGEGNDSGDTATRTRTATEVRSPTRTSTEVRSPTKTSTSTDAYTAGNVTVTGGAGAGAYTDVNIFQQKPKERGGSKRVSRGSHPMRENPDEDDDNTYQAKAFADAAYRVKIGSTHSLSAHGNTMTAKKTGVNRWLISQSSSKQDALSTAKSDLVNEALYFLESGHLAEDHKELYRFIHGKESPGGRHQNPADDAALFYESFHGAPSKEVVEIEEEEFYHGHLAELGVLIELQIVTVNGDKAVLTFDAGEDRKKNPAQGNESNARELEMFTENNANLYRQQEQPIQKNLITKMAKGIYNHAGAVKLYGYLMENGAKKYVKEHGSPGDVWHEMFNTATRKIAAERFADSFETEAGLGNYDNYLPKKYAGWSGKQWTGRKSNPSDHVDTDTVLLCSSEDGTSLYLMGGDQSINLSDLKIKHEKDLTVIGDITHIVYRTAKEFDDFEDIDYIHEFSEDTGEATPELIYDSKNQKLKIAGGAYKIDAPLVGVSPGIEN